MFSPNNHKESFSMFKTSLTMTFGDSYSNLYRNVRSTVGQKNMADVIFNNLSTINKSDIEDTNNVRFNLSKIIDQSSIDRYQRFVNNWPLYQPLSNEADILASEEEKAISKNGHSSMTYIFAGNYINDILANARNRLKQTKEFSVCILAQDQKTNAQRLLVQSLIQDESPAKAHLKTLNSGYQAMQEILVFCSKGKEHSIAVQDHLDLIPEKDIAVLGELAQQKLWSLIYDRYANYTVQKIASLNHSFRHCLVAFCKRSFAKLAANEFSSRVMQSLAELSDDFRYYCHEYFRQKPKALQSHISTVFLAASAIRSSKSQSEFAFYGKMLQKRPKLLNCKYFKRIIVSYIEKCEPDELERVYINLNIQGRVSKLLDDKYYAYIILMLVQRHSPSMIAELSKEYKLNFKKTISAKFTGFLLTKLVDRDDSTTLSKVHNIVCSTHTSSLNEIKNSEGLILLFIYALVASADPKTGLSSKASSLLTKADSHLEETLL